MRVEFADEAERSLERIGDYIAQHSPSRAVSFTLELRAAAMALGDAPRAYPLVRRFERLGVRRRVHGNYVILYRVEADRVLVIQIVHGARDYGGLLLPKDQRSQRFAPAFSWAPKIASSGEVISADSHWAR